MYVSLSVYVCMYVCMYGCRQAGRQAGRQGGREGGMDVCAWLFSWLSCCAVAMPSVKRAGGGAGEGAAPPPQKTKYSDHPGTDTLLLPPFLPSSLAGFLASFLPSFLPASLPARLPACLPSFLPSFLPRRQQNLEKKSQNTLEKIPQKMGFPSFKALDFDSESRSVELVDGPICSDQSAVAEAWQMWYLFWLNANEKLSSSSFVRRTSLPTRENSV